MSLLTEVFDSGLVEWKLVKNIVGDLCYGGQATSRYERTSNDSLLHLYCHNMFQEDKKLMVSRAISSC